MTKPFKFDPGAFVADYPDDLRTPPIPCEDPCVNVYRKALKRGDVKVTSGIMVARYLLERNPLEPISTDHYNVRQMIKPEYGEYKEETAIEFNANEVPDDIKRKLWLEYPSVDGQLYSRAICKEPCVCHEVPGLGSEVVPDRRDVFEERIEFDAVVSEGKYPPAPGEAAHIAPPVDKIRQGNGQPIDFDPDCDILNYFHMDRLGRVTWQVVRRYDSVVTVDLTYSERRVNGQCIDLDGYY